MSCSTEVPFNPRSDGTLVVEQTLSLVATLYQEASGEFQEKTAKLILRQSKVCFIQNSCKHQHEIFHVTILEHCKWHQINCRGNKQTFLQTSRIVGTVFKGLGVVLLKLNELMQELLT